MTGTLTERATIRAAVRDMPASSGAKYMSVERSETLENAQVFLTVGLAVQTPRFAPTI
jgi:hypothetical protein